MADGERTVSAPTLAQIAYLARSRNRIVILETLATGPHSTRELESTTGISRSTLERITTELEEREWADRTVDGKYVLSERGVFVAEETRRYVGSIEAIQTLDDAVTWLPKDELMIDLRHFEGAQVLRPERNDVAAADTRMITLMRDADEVACLSNTAGTVGLETAMMEGFAEGRFTVENVITPAELDIYRRDSERAARWKEYLEAGASVYCYDGAIPCILVLIDEVVFIGDRRLETLGVIESSDEVVRSWAGELLATYRDKAERIDASAIEGEISAEVEHNP